MVSGDEDEWRDGGVLVARPTTVAEVQSTEDDVARTSPHNLSPRQARARFGTPDCILHVAFGIWHSEYDAAFAAACRMYDSCFRAAMCCLTTTATTD